MADTNEVTFSSLREMLRSSPDGVVVYATTDGWKVRKGNASLVDENNRKPRIWKDLDRAMTQLKGLGVRNLEVKLA